jgi:hypothetical protein
MASPSVCWFEESQQLAIGQEPRKVGLQSSSIAEGIAPLSRILRDLLGFFLMEKRNTIFPLAALYVIIALPSLCGQAPDAGKGAVCNGFYGPFVIQEHELSRVYFTVGDSGKLFFDHPETVVLNNLDLHKTYVVRVFYDKKPIESWKLRFDRLKVHMVTVWRSPGYWHMDPNPSGKCGER